MGVSNYFSEVSEQEINLRNKIKIMFSKFPTQDEFKLPVSPLRMEDIPEERCFKFFDGSNKQILSLSVSEIKLLPERISCYFKCLPEQRIKIASKEYSKLKLGKPENVNDMIASIIIMSLESWSIFGI